MINRSQLVPLEYLSLLLHMQRVQGLCVPTLKMVSKSFMTWLLALLFALANLSGGLAKVPCKCFIAERYSGRKLINYGKVQSYSWWKFGKQRKCSAKCASRCASDIQDGNKVCAAIGSDYDNSGKKIGCFSVVGKSDSKNKKWDYDGVATFTRCEKTCSCSEGMYNPDRNSCVQSFGPLPVDIDDGPLRDGAYVKGGVLYKDIAAPECVVKAVYT